MKGRGFLVHRPAASHWTRHSTGVVICVNQDFYFYCVLCLFSLVYEQNPSYTTCHCYQILQREANLLLQLGRHEPTTLEFVHSKSPSFLTHRRQKYLEILANNQSDALFSCICLFYLSTYFEYHSAHHQELELC